MREDGSFDQKEHDGFGWAHGRYPLPDRVRTARDFIADEDQREASSLGEFLYVVGMLVPELGHLKGDAYDLVYDHLASRYLTREQFAGPETMPPGVWQENLQFIREQAQKLLEEQNDLLLQEIFGPPPDGTLILRSGGWTICPFEHRDGFAITPPVVPQP